MTTLLSEFTAITKALNESGIEYAVCGGWAMAIHGLPRATMDIDMLVMSEDLGKILETVKSLGYDVEGRPLHFDVEIRRVSKISQEMKQLITLDLILVDELMADVWSGRETIPWAHGRTPVVSREGLVKMKLLAGRPQDMLDIAAIKEEEDAGRHGS